MLADMRRWTAAYRFRYLPVISFERRRSALLDWVEDHLEPVAFRDERDEVGISLARGVRIRIGRSGATLEDAVASKHGVESLWPALEGLMEAMEPRSLSLSAAFIAWSNDVPDRAYAEVAQTLAERVTGVSSPLGSGLRPTDVAPLVDFMNDRFHVQGEYGIVDPPELRQRINDEDLGRLNGRPPGLVTERAVEKAAAVSLFVDTSVYLKEPEVIADQAGMQRAIGEFETVAREVAEAIAAAITEREIAR